MRDTIEGSNYLTTFTFDSYGRQKTITHPSGITESISYNNSGYVDSISAGGSARYTITGMNLRGQTTSVTYGSNLNGNNYFDAYGFPDSVKTGSIQGYRYSFNPVTGNLNSRQNYLRNKSESFTYDNLYRLTDVDGPQDLTMTYEANGNILTKSDIGTSDFGYGEDAGPYALTSLSSSTLVIPTFDQDVTYNSFQKVSTISENDTTATLIYNSDNERAKMVVTDSGNTILTRWYVSGSYMEETAGGATTKYTFIGGDAYTAPLVAVTSGGTTNYYYLLRDHLGNITHQVNTSNTVVAEYSFDAWGRRRNPSDWSYNLSGQPELFAGRGFTGHEHLPWFNLINMNGRLYDPLVGRMLSPDPNVQIPDYTQNYNRYSYALNNPLINTDPNGEFIFTLLAAFIPGAQFLLPAAMQLDMGWMVGGINAAQNGGNFWEGALKGGASSIINAGLAMLNVPGIMPNGFLHAGTNIIGSGISNTIMDRPFFENWGMSAGEGFAGGAYSGYELSKKMGLNPWTGGLNQEQHSIWADYKSGNITLQEATAKMKGFGEAFISGLKMGAMGAVTGGIIGGGSALLRGKNVLTGNDLKVEAPTTFKPPKLEAPKSEIDESALRTKMDPIPGSPEEVSTLPEPQTFNRIETGDGNVSWTVTKEGVILPKGATIQEGLIENPYRSSSYGIIENGKFIEKIRIDPGTIPGVKGSNISHFHINNGNHIFDQNKWPWKY